MGQVVMWVNNNRSFINVIQIQWKKTYNQLAKVEHVQLFKKLIKPQKDVQFCCLHGQFFMIQLIGPIKLSVYFSLKITKLGHKIATYKMA